MLNSTSHSPMGCPAALSKVTVTWSLSSISTRNVTNQVPADVARVSVVAGLPDGQADGVCRRAVKYAEVDGPRRGA